MPARSPCERGSLTTWNFCDAVWPPIVIVAVYSPGGNSAPDLGPLLKSRALSQRTGPSARRSQYIRCKPALVGTQGYFFGLPTSDSVSHPVFGASCCWVCDGVAASAGWMALCSAVWPVIAGGGTPSSSDGGFSPSSNWRVPFTVRTTRPCESVITNCPGSLTSFARK